MKVLCVAEKPSIAKSVAQILGGGRVNVRNTGNKFIKNYDFTYRFPAPWGEAEVTMTSVVGHIMAADFDARYRSWQSCAPQELFHSQIVIKVDDDKKAVAQNIRTESRHAAGLMIWTDCDREGEHIGSEVCQIAREANPRLAVKRARFSNLERQHIHAAAQNPQELDQRQADAVGARIEIDLRLGAAFTRFQTLGLRDSSQKLSSSLISYGSCQFPTLGFVVDRFKRVAGFVPECFWYISVMCRREDIDVTFKWKRNHLFDRMAVTLIMERCLEATEARVVSVVKKPTSKWRPLPLTTVELQKRGSMFLGLSAKRVMDIAEKLYTQGFVSYPRTETDRFDPGMDLQALVRKQTADNNWGAYAQGLLDGGFRAPRQGKNDDHAHPPIHPVAHVSMPAIDHEHHRVYTLIVQHFLACCSDDAKGESVEIMLDWSRERFSASGLTVLQRNYLDVYPYDRWTSTQMLPTFTQGEMVPLTETKIKEGKTTAPNYLTEAELIALMDSNGIGTDATMAEHIETILTRQYAVKVPKGAPGRYPDPLTVDFANAPWAGSGRGGASGRGQRAGRRGARGGRAARGGRGGAAGSAGNSGGGNMEFIPTTLGVALVEGYNEIGFEKSLSKPLLRKEMEIMMREICDGRKTKNEVVNESIRMYEEVFERASAQIRVLREVSGRWPG
ncbi:DNA topoisomerase [Dipodascopsis tothii]|uniref:DNA topoisomerase n=1 Tax=Dipodascopsis tothii TaxID=44089 RepID=UPI0034CD0BE2